MLQSLAPWLLGKLSERKHLRLMIVINTTLLDD